MCRSCEKRRHGGFECSKFRARKYSRSRFNREYRKNFHIANLTTATVLIILPVTGENSVEHTAAQIPVKTDPPDSVNDGGRKIHIELPETLVDSCLVCTLSNEKISVLLFLVIIVVLLTR